MLSCKELPTEIGNSQVTTQSVNTSEHPGTDAENVLRIQQCWDPKVVQVEKEKKRANKEEKEGKQQAGAARKEAAQRHLEDY